MSYGLVEWSKRFTYGYPGVEIEDITWSWADGLAFCALLHNFRPQELGDFRRLKTDTREDKINNLELAFSIAEKDGIPRLLEAEDLVDFGKPDKKCMATYLSHFPKIYGDLDAKYPAGIMTKEEHAEVKKKKEAEFLEAFRKSKEGGGNPQLQTMLNKRKTASGDRVDEDWSDDEEEAKPGKLTLPTFEQKKEEKPISRAVDLPAPGKIKTANVFQQQQEEKKRKMAEMKARLDKQGSSVPASTINNDQGKQREEELRKQKEREHEERKEQERVRMEELAKRKEKEQLEKERLEKERLEKERLEKERLEKERIESERVARIETEKKATETAIPTSSHSELNDEERRAQRRLQRVQERHRGDPVNVETTATITESTQELPKEPSPLKEEPTRVSSVNTEPSSVSISSMAQVFQKKPLVTPKVDPKPEAPTTISDTVKLNPFKQAEIERKKKLDQIRSRQQ